MIDFLDGHSLLWASMPTKLQISPKKQKLITLFHGGRFTMAPELRAAQLQSLGT